MKFAIYFVLGILSIRVSLSQQTGSFTRTVNFGGNPGWSLCYYVPPGYNAANKYKLIIGLHGLGDTPQDYRDYISGLSTVSGSPVNNAIIVCPYAGSDVNTDFWSPVSDTGIITKCISDAMSVFNIASDYIYLNGYSLGGRSALRYGLLNYWRFRGLELWTPAFQSINEANNLTSFSYIWQNGKHIPICMTVGSEDTYGVRVATAYQHLSDAGAIANLKIIDGMGHSPPPSAEMFGCFYFLDSNASSRVMNDARVRNITSPFDEECSASFSPVIVVQNMGANNLTSAILNYQIDNGPVNTYNWSGNLKMLDADTITLPAQPVPAGIHVFKAFTSLPNGMADAVPSDDGMTKTFNSITTGTSSLSEGFEGAAYPPNGWQCVGPDAAWSWVKKSGGTSGGNGQSASSIRFDNYTPDNTGKRYSIRTAQCDFTNATNPVLSYDYAYAPYQNGSNVDTDTLSVYYSTNCGNTWTFLLKKGGLALSTAGGAVGTVFVPTSVQWKKETINLPGSIIGQSKVMFSFEDISGYGNMLYLDNINLTGVTGISNETQESPSLIIYPNPNSGVFNVQCSMFKAGNADVVDIMGRKIISKKFEYGAFDMDLTMQPNGIYFINIKTESESITQKVIILK